MIKKIIKIILQHKIIAGIIILLLVIGGYFGLKAIRGNGAETRYVLATVEKGTLITSVSGSGQISASNQVDIKPKASGDVLRVAVKNGQEVAAGSILIQLNAQETYKTVRDAQANLESAKLSLEKLEQPADQLSILQAENTLAQAKESLQKAKNDLNEAYEDGFNDVANAFLDLPSIMTGLNDILYSYTMGGTNQQNLDYYYNATKIYEEEAYQYKDDANDAYQAARTAYDKNFDSYKSASRFSETSVIESLIDETYDTTRNIAEAVKNTNNLIQLYKDKLTEHNLKPQTLADTHLSSLNTYTGKTNTHLMSLLSVKQTIVTSKETIVNSERTIAEKTESLAQLKAGADPLDIQSQELTVKQRQNALLDAQEKLADYTIRAPFAGVVVAIDVEKGESISSGTTAATLITKQKMAEISLNEVDVAKVKVGQKVTLTFDAIEGLSISGEVAEIDAIGTVSQGVVTYNVKIVFDTQDERVKAGMSVSAAIITEIKTDVLMVANSAVKSLGENYYVEMPSEEIASSTAEVSSSGISLKSPLRQQVVQIGLVNDSMTEIVSGLNEGDKIIVRTINTSSTQSQSSSSGNNGSDGGMMMFR